MTSVAKPADHQWHKSVNVADPSNVAVVKTPTSKESWPSKQEIAGSMMLTYPSAIARNPLAQSAAWRSALAVSGKTPRPGISVGTCRNRVRLRLLFVVNLSEADLSVESTAIWLGCPFLDLPMSSAPPMAKAITRFINLLTINRLLERW